MHTPSSRRSCSTCVSNTTSWIASDCRTASEGVCTGPARANHVRSARTKAYLDGQGDGFSYSLVLCSCCRRSASANNPRISEYCQIYHASLTHLRSICIATSSPGNMMWATMDLQVECACRKELSKTARHGRYHRDIQACLGTGRLRSLAISKQDHHNEALTEWFHTQLTEANKEIGSRRRCETRAEAYLAATWPRSHACPGSSLPFRQWPVSHLSSQPALSLDSRFQRYAYWTTGCERYCHAAY